MLIPPETGDDIERRESTKIDGGSVHATSLSSEHGPDARSVRHLERSLPRVAPWAGCTGLDMMAVRLEGHNARCNLLEKSCLRDHHQSPIMSGFGLQWRAPIPQVARPADSELPELPVISFLSYQTSLNFATALVPSV